MSLFLQTLLNGLLYGGVLSVAALGFSLIFGVMNVINLAHGVFVIGGAYAALVAWSTFKIDPLLALPLIMAAGFVLGFALQRTVIQPAVARGSPVAALLVTFGFALIVLNLLSVVFSSAVQSVSPGYSFISITVLDTPLDAVRLVAFAASLVLTGLLTLFLHRSRAGRIIKAVAQSELGARLCGVDARNVYALTFGVSSAFAAAAGVLIAMVLPFTPADETLWTIYAFIVVTLGGVGSPAGALLGGIAMALAASFTQTYVGALYTNALMFLILLVMLLVRPSGLLGNSFKASR